MKPLIYIASPYTKGDVAVNVRAQHEIFDVLMNDGRCLPYAPLVSSHYQHIVYPRPYKHWIGYDLDLIDYCTACLRLPAIHDRPNLDYSYAQIESSGADGEVARFTKQGKPVFYHLFDLMGWLDKQ